MRYSLVFVLFLFGFSAPAISAEVIKRSIPNAQIVGEGRLTYAFWDVYDATLYAPSGALKQNKPFALSLRYMREIKGEDIADRSVQEIRKQGFSNEESLAIWHEQMKAIFPDVQDGTVLSAVFIPNQKTIFYHDNQPIGTIQDGEFTRLFSNIWLSEKTSEPELRKELLGLL
jgi:hypothetical protein